MQQPSSTIEVQAGGSQLSPELFSNRGGSAHPPVAGPPFYFLEKITRYVRDVCNMLRTRQIGATRTSVLLSLLLVSRGGSPPQGGVIQGRAAPYKKGVSHVYG